MTDTMRFVLGGDLDRLTAPHDSAPGFDIFVAYVGALVLYGGGRNRKCWKNNPPYGL